MYGLKLAGVEVNRKMLSEMAIADPAGFAALAELRKEQISIMKVKASRYYLLAFLFTKKLSIY